MAGLTGWHLLVLVLVILLLFGAAKLPALAKSMGQSARVFKGEMKAMKDEDTSSSQAAEGSSAADALLTSSVSENTSSPKSDGTGSGNSASS